MKEEFDMGERFTLTDRDTIMDNEYGFEICLEEACELLNEYVGIICSHTPHF